MSSFLHSEQLPKFLWFSMLFYSSLLLLLDFMFSLSNIQIGFIKQVHSILEFVIIILVLFDLLIMLVMFIIDIAAEHSFAIVLEPIIRRSLLRDHLLCLSFTNLDLVLLLLVLLIILIFY